ncbi:alpha/beta hydrolase [Pacificoceanicola onchidii]|uniref:alpha/beta hydrolase n=1 Tax=Pacificoceanicola onchidii TaxID=2562685 RepID=UPI0010A5FC1F|nr:alpha/beta hydrolase [Pacificoceanicola onchidii]
MTETYHHLSHAPTGGAPLIFAFHGTGGDETQFFDFTRQIAPQAGVVSPRGDVSEFGAARFFRRTGEGVYDMDDLARATAKMAAFVEGWKAQHPGSPAYGFGYSNGANILASVMMARPDLFDRIGLLHPLIPWTPEPAPGLRGKEVLITAGRNDPICPWPMTDRLVSWTRAQGAAVETVVHDGGHEIRREEGTALAGFLQAPTMTRGEAQTGDVA